jgi:dTDP-4-dehydrorhamnose 3,5-epimerase
MFTPLAIPDVIMIEPRRYSDERGWFGETYKEKDWNEAGVRTRFVQDNESMSIAPGTLRGLHFQVPPMAQAKLVRCTQGSVFDVAVDIRRSSPTFGQYVAVELSAGNGRQMYVPVGFAHGFCTLESNSIVQYKVSAPYDPRSERGVAWDDPSLRIRWPMLQERAVLSPRDRALPTLASLPAYF